MTTTSSIASLKRTPLFAEHSSAGAKFVEFGGWEMPVQFSGVIDEHQTVRSAVGLFDVSHMGEISVRGPRALEYLQYMTVNDVAKLTPGRAQYTLLLNDEGGTVDDIIIYMLAPEDYLLCVNAANTAKDYAWLTSHNSIGAVIEDVSAEFAQIAIQGPKARALLADLLGQEEQAISGANFRPFSFRKETCILADKSEELLIAATGYTGEDGVEVFCSPQAAPALWRRLMELGARHGVKPCGLGARDTLRLEAGFPLHGHELRDDLSALTSNVTWVIKLSKAEDYIGKQALLKQKEQGVPHKLVGFEVKDRGIVREEAELRLNGEKVGWSSSGTKPPTVNKAVGMAFVVPEHAKPGVELIAEVRGRELKVELVPLPFYKLKLN